MVFYIENPRESIDKLTTNKRDKQGYKNNINTEKMKSSYRPDTFLYK